MNSFFGFTLLLIGIIMGGFAIDNILELETLTILNTTMILCTICGIGFAGILLSPTIHAPSNHSKIPNWDDDDD